MPIMKPDYYKSLLLSTFIAFCSLSTITFAEAEMSETPTLPTTANQAENKIKILFNTSEGKMVFELDPVNAPISVKNFIAYAEEGFYEGVIFHRVIPGFMIQTGGFDIRMNRKQTREPIKNEANNGLRNLRGTLAMARTGIVDSATSQFFINLADNQFLDHSERGFGYAVFGKVIEGMDVVSKIGKSKTTRRGNLKDVPVEAISITSVKIIQTEPVSTPPSQPGSLQIKAQ